LPKNDEGEFELILGNRQLISVFVIVVALLGVFFSMGYIVGRNSSAAGAEVARADKSNDKSSGDTHAADSAPDSPSSAEPSDGSSPSATAPDDSPPSSTQPEKPPAAPAPAQRAPASAQAAKPKPFPAREATPTPERVPLTGQVPVGQYWQVVATSRPDAEIISEALGKKGFHAVLAPAPKDGVFRVLVGPLGDASAQAQTRTNLEAAGFKNPIMRKY
jgi:cell division septation protein DedD